MNLCNYVLLGVAWFSISVRFSFLICEDSAFLNSTSKCIELGSFSCTIYITTRYKIQFFKLMPTLLFKRENIK
jgi:hypothetical protein